ncbi:MAG: 1-acyl-sn-glycerol-3-phosphate acyltransferase [Lachnospiraceae bacterium]|nr:1-acyl-sn-glycerol-3-phosphate acyltransferase [Lachnospiraceae bacterium]
MLRLIYVIFISLPFVIFYLGKAVYYSRHGERYSEKERYDLARRMIHIMKRNGKINTIGYGQEKLPKESGYVMFSNHQGKYDTLGIMAVHDRPCTVVIDEKASRQPLADQFIDLIKGVRLDKSDMRKQVKAIRNIANEVKSGRNFIIFAEGGYDNNKNALQEFLAGAFKCAQISRSPIVPVAIYDSYKPFGVNSLKRVCTLVSFLDPIPYEEYKEMNTTMIAQMVKQRIEEEMENLSAIKAEMSAAVNII